MRSYKPPCCRQRCSPGSRRISGPGSPAYKPCRPPRALGGGTRGPHSGISTPPLSAAPCRQHEGLRGPAPSRCCWEAHGKWGRQGCAGPDVLCTPWALGSLSHPLGCGETDGAPGLLCVWGRGYQWWKLLRMPPSGCQEGQVVFLFHSRYGALKAPPPQQRAEVMRSVQSSAGGGEHGAELLCWRGCGWRWMQLGGSANQRWL